MGYLQMQLMNETTETITIGICLKTLCPAAPAMLQ